MENENSFDSLVSGISKDERQLILDKMGTSTISALPETEGEAFVPIEEVSIETEIPLSDMLNKESLFLRFIIFLKSIFTNTKPELLFNEMKVAEVAKNLQKNFPGLVDAKKGLFLSLFYDKLVELKTSAEFFRPYIAAIEKDIGNFYVFLGSIVIPEVDMEMADNVDPYSNPVVSEVKLELRVELLRKMDDVFQSITPDLRQKMYESVKSIEWLRQFVKLPFIKFESLFTEITDTIHTCQFSQIENEIAAFAKLLCNSFSLSDSLFEALYKFSTRNSRKLIDEETQNAEFEDFMNKSRSNVAILHMFMSSVPMHSISRVVYGKYQWIPEKFYGGEDWFSKYKANWKKLFEQKWDAWVIDCKKENLRQRLNGHFGLEHFPMLPNRPWLNFSTLKFRYELTAGFLTWYYLEKFPKNYELPLKNIMLEGNFKKKENRVEFTDSFNEMIQISIAITAFNGRLKPIGDVGTSFSKFNADAKVHSLQEQSSMEKIIRNVESDMQSIIHRFGDTIRSLEAVLSGILGLRKDNKYDSLTNLSHIQGRDNSAFVATLTEARQSFESALNLISELETIDAPQFISD